MPRARVPLQKLKIALPVPRAVCVGDRLLQRPGRNVESVELASVCREEFAPHRRARGVEGVKLHHGSHVEPLDELVVLVKQVDKLLCVRRAQVWRVLRVVIPALRRRHHNARLTRVALATIVLRVRVDRVRRRVHDCPRVDAIIVIVQMGAPGLHQQRTVRREVWELIFPRRCPGRLRRLQNLLCLYRTSCRRFGAPGGLLRRRLRRGGRLRGVHRT